MFKAITTDPKLFRDCVEIIAQLIDDGLFRVNKDGIELVAADRATVAVVDFKIKAGAFENFEIDKEERFGINMPKLLTILKRANTSDRMILTLIENKLDITLYGKSTRKFSVPLIDLSQEEVPPISQFKFPAIAEIKSDVIDEGISDAEIIADSVVVEMSDGFHMYSEGDSSRTELHLESGNAALLSLSTNGSVKARYPLDYMKKIIKAAKLAETAKVHIGNDYPMRIDFQGNNVFMTFVLAPRVMETD